MFPFLFDMKQISTFVHIHSDITTSCTSLRYYFQCNGNPYDESSDPFIPIYRNSSVSSPLPSKTATNFTELMKTFPYDTLGSCTGVPLQSRILNDSFEKLLSLENNCFSPVTFSFFAMEWNRVPELFVAAQKVLAPTEAVVRVVREVKSKKDFHVALHVRLTDFKTWCKNRVRRLFMMKVNL